MLGRVLSKRLNLIFKNQFKLSSTHEHDDHSHGHHDYSVHIDKNAKLVKYVSNPLLVSVTGVQDQYYKLQPRLTDDPFHHVRQAPFFSFNSLLYTNDAWFHDDSHQPYNSLPDRGYLDGDDPLDSRSIFAHANYYTIGVFLTILLLMAAVDRKMIQSQARLWREKHARDYVVDKLEQKNAVLNNLLELEQKLKSQL